MDAPSLPAVKHLQSPSAPYIDLQQLPCYSLVFRYATYCLCSCLLNMWKMLIQPVLNVKLLVVLKNPQACHLMIKKTI